MEISANILKQIGVANPTDEIVENKTYNTVDKTEIVTTVAYLMGLNKESLYERYGVENHEIIKKLEADENATAIRYLCRLRNTMMNNFQAISDAIAYEMKSILQIELFNRKEIEQLQRWGYEVIMPNCRAERYQEQFTKLINENIYKCEKLFYEWVNFDYIKSLFIIPKYNKTGVLKTEAIKYNANKNCYPFQLYMNWEPQENGNILYSDGKFLNTIYEMNHDRFIDRSKYKDAVDDTKDEIYRFIDDCHKVVLVVDCENSDCFKLYSVLKNLNQEELDKVEKIVLYDDYHTSCGWDYLEKYTKIPVEHKEVNRVLESKSLVDVQMTAGICTEHYRNTVDSFILCSSDSDFWAVISSLPTAKFLVMYEYKKCSDTMKQTWYEKGIKNCSMDDFYSGNASDLQKKVLLDKLKQKLPNIIGKNGREIVNEVFAETRVTASDTDKLNFYNKYVKNIRLRIDEQGSFVLEMAS